MEKTVELEAVINIIHSTILDFLELEEKDNEYLSNTGKLLFKINKTICNKIKELPDMNKNKEV